MPIRRLSVQLANQIAAGEVVERPSSVVKELLENAVDAKATEITLEIRVAGKMLIRVTDNGCGIPKEELPLALAQHATSKISCQEDLEAIHTLGFRGEALASIASVSRLRLISATADQDMAYQIAANGLDQTPVITPAAHPQGTSVYVEELFFNTPARRRFLKSDKTEFLHIKDLFTRIALVNPEIAFRFVAEGRLQFQLPAISYPDISRRLAKLLGPEYARDGIFFDNTSAEFKQWMKDVGFSEEVDPAKSLAIKGVILQPPTMLKPMPERLLTFLNSRMISDRVVNHALRDTYASVLLDRHDRFKPALRAVLFMNCDPYEIDVNVHPRKDEVRFHNLQGIHESITLTLQTVMQHVGMFKERVSQSFLGVEQKTIEKAEAQGLERPVFMPAPAPKLKPEYVAPRQSVISSAEAICAEQNLERYFQEVKAAELKPQPVKNVYLPGRICNFTTLRSQLEEAKARQKALECAPFLFKEGFTEGTSPQQQEEQSQQHSAIVDVQSFMTLSPEEEEFLLKKAQQDSSTKQEVKDQESQTEQQPEGRVTKEEQRLQHSVASMVDADLQELLLQQKKRQEDNEQGEINDAQKTDEIKNGEMLQAKHESSKILFSDAELSAVENQRVNNLFNKEELCHEGEGAGWLGLENISLQGSLFDEVEASLQEQKERTESSVEDNNTRKRRAEEPLQERSLIEQEQSSRQDNASSGVFAEETMRAGAESYQEQTDNLSTDSFFVGSEVSEKIRTNYARHELALSLLRDYPDAPQGEFLTLISPDVLLFRLETKYYLAKGSALFCYFSAFMYRKQIEEDSVPIHTLEVGFSLKESEEVFANFQMPEVIEYARRCGFSYVIRKAVSCLELKTIPKMIQGANIARVAARALDIVVQICLGAKQEQVQYLFTLSKLIAETQDFTVVAEADGKLLVSKIKSLQMVEGIAYPQEVRELRLFELAQSMSR